MIGAGHSLRCIGIGFTHAHWQDVEWLVVTSLPIKMCVCQCSIVLGRFAYLSYPVASQNADGLGK